MLHIKISKSTTTIIAIKKENKTRSPNAGVGCIDLAGDGPGLLRMDDGTESIAFLLTRRSLNVNDERLCEYDLFVCFLFIAVK